MNMRVKYALKMFDFYKIKFKKLFGGKIFWLTCRFPEIRNWPYWLLRLYDVAKFFGSKIRGASTPVRGRQCAVLSIKLIPWLAKCLSCLLTLQTTTLCGQRTRVSTACWRYRVSRPPAMAPLCWRSTVLATGATTRAWPPIVTCRFHGTATWMYSFC